MKVYTYSEARQNLATLLEEAYEQGEVIIKRRDGKTFTVKFSPTNKSPLNVEGINLGLTGEEILSFIDEGRKRY